MSPAARPLALLLAVVAAFAAAALPVSAARADTTASVAVGQGSPAKSAAAKRAKKAKRAKRAAKARRQARAKRRKTIDPGLGKAWAKRYRVRKGEGDPDHDGLSNLGEFQAGTHPKRSDSDGDGLADGAEHMGTIKAVSPTGATIALFGGGTLTASFTADTAFSCASDPFGGDIEGVDDATLDLLAGNAVDDDEDPADADDPATDDDGGDVPADADEADEADADDDASAPCADAAAGDPVYEAATSGAAFDTFDLVG